jgi:hypothetical protein
MDSGNHSISCAHPKVVLKIDQMRLIIHEGLKPVESAWKTFLLQDVDFMRKKRPMPESAGGRPVKLCFSRM